MGKCAIVGMACPQTADPNAKWFCPCWQPMTLTNPATGDTKIINCNFEARTFLDIEVIRAVNAPAAEIEATRAEIAKGFGTLAKIVAAIASTKYQIEAE
jgi:hypothetical protein